MSDAVVIAIITAVQAVTVAFVGGLFIRLGKVRRDTTATREQVVNHHDTNMREENDSRHAETRGWFNQMRGELRTVVRDIGGIREDIRGIRSDHRALARRVDNHIEREEHHDQ